MRDTHTPDSPLLASEELYRAVTDALDEGIVLYAADGTISGCNASACRILGRSEAEIVGRSAYDPDWRAVCPDGSVVATESHPAAITLASGQPCVHLVLGFDRPDDERVWVSLSSRPLCRRDETEPYAVVVSFTDITPRQRFEEEQLRLQEAIRKSASEWRLTFDAITHPVMLLELDGKIIRVNEAARDLAGLTYEQVLHRPVAFLWRSEPWQAICTLLPQVATIWETAAAQARDDQGRAWDVSLSPVTSPDGQRGVVVVARDITDLVRLQESLRRSETMSAMGALVAGVAHEVRNPLFGISATLDAFASRFEERAEYRPYVDILQGEVARLGELMQQLLDYGKPFRLVLAPESPLDVMRAALAACQPLADRAQVELAEEIAPDLPSLPMDRNRILQVFQNLLENAIQHAPPGSRVIFRAAPVSLEEREGIRFSVEDTGPGFRPEDLPHICQPFFTRRPGGTGLGLSIVQRIVEHHEGQIVPANRPEGGAVVAVLLPLAAQALPKWERVV